MRIFYCYRQGTGDSSMFKRIFYWLLETTCKIIKICQLIQYEKIRYRILYGKTCKAIRAGMKFLFTMMKNVLLFLLLLLKLSACSQAVKNEGLLWKITGKDLEQSSYLFGTFHGTHGIGAEFLDSIPGFYDAFNSVTQYVGESDFSSENMEAINEYFVKYYGERQMPADITYEDLLSENDYEYLDLTVRVSLRRFMKDVNKIRPNYLWFMICQAKTSDFMQQVFGVSKKETMDIYLLKSARNKEYTVKGLDSPDIQIKTFELLYGDTPLPQSLQESADTLINKMKSIEAALNPKHYGQELAENIINFENAYKRQDLSGLEKYKKEQLDMMKDASVSVDMDFLLEGRSLSWMETIPELISSQPTMIGVGACHLYGKDGLINLLRQKGYQLEIVK